MTRYFCVAPLLIDTDRTRRGDMFVKPTQYWFANCQPSNNEIQCFRKDNKIGIKDAIRKMPNGKMVGAKDLKTARSMIHPDYANRFIREFILTPETLKRLEDEAK